jgi:hypothetical protein
MTYIALAMRKRIPFTAFTLGLLSFAVVAARADTSADAYRAMGIRPADVLTGTVLTAKVLPGPDKQVVSVTTYFTGSKEKDDAVNVRLDVFRRAGELLTRVYGRDFGAESDGPVGEGELQLIDLDLDGINEIIASFQSFVDPLIEQRLGEVLVNEQGEFRSAWSGLLDYDATKAARDVPRERRDRFRREFDFPNTMRTRGITLFMNKQMIAVAGERLPAPKAVQETFPLRPPETTP